MLDSPFYVQMFICLIFMAIASYGLFFSKSFKSMLMAGFFTLVAMTFQFLATDFFRSSVSGQIIAFFLWSFFLIEGFFFDFFLNTELKKKLTVYPFAFLAFITMAISVDLLTFLFGFVLFSLAFVGLFSFQGKEKKNLLVCIQKNLVAFFTFSYGILLLYVREATLQTKDLYLKLKISLRPEKYDELIVLGFSFLILSVLIELYALLPLLGRKR